MPEYLAPGVYVEETSFRSKSIEGVSTTTTGFIGPTRYGPFDLEPDIITSLGEFVRTYGDGERLKFGDVEMDNHMWHAARAFFTEGGKRLYVSRVYLPADGAGQASKTQGGVTFTARYPGAYGNFSLRLTLRSGRNVLGRRKTGSTVERTVGALSENDVVWIRAETSPATSPPTGGASGTGQLFLAVADPGKPLPWKFKRAIASPLSTDFFHLSDSVPSGDAGEGESVRVVTLTLEILDAKGATIGVWTDLPLDPKHKTGGLADSLFEVFKTGADFRALPIIADCSGSAIDVLSGLFNAADLADGDKLAKGVVHTVILEDGSDGARPGSGEYEGQDNPALLVRTGLKQFEAIDDISIVAAPGCTANYGAYADDANAIMGMLIAHATNMRYRIAILDCAPRQSIADVRKMRAKIDSKYAAFYYPWVKVMDPITRRLITLPPSGFVAGIYARNDITRAVFKAPANEVINLALGFETMVSKAQQEVLNPEGINCLRFFEGRGMLVWGARTISSDPEWKYVNLRRYFAYAEHSIDKGTQWAVFEPNGERLWANVRRTIEDFLLNEWQNGALLGDKPDRSYFVKCDRSTMTQNDLDNGRLVCQVGVAALRPAEFVIFRVGQWTADRKA